MRTTYRTDKKQAFLLTNFALTGPPLFLFILFTLTVFVFSLVAALVVGLLAALVFTVFMVGVALIIVFPAVFFTSLVACFLFLWGLGGYYIFKWFNKGDTPAAPGSALGDKLNQMTGGKLNFMMSNAREGEKKRETDPSHGTAPPSENDFKNSMNPNAAAQNIQKGMNGAASNAQKAMNGGVNGATSNVQKGVNGGLNSVGKSTGLDGVTGKAGNATKTTSGTVGTAKGAVGGLTGLT